MASSAVLYDLIARDRASTQFARVGRAADGLGGKMSKLGKVAGVTGAALVGIGAAALEAADKAAAFQTSMTKIQTLAGGSAKDVASLSKQVLSLAPSTQQGPQQLADSLYHLKSVGMDNAKAMKSLKVASDLAAVGGADLEETTNALAGAWRTGIKGATTFKEAAKTVNAVIGAGNMTMQDFVDAIGTGILPSAKTFGLSLSQVGSALALFTDEGVPASDAATRLRMSISLLGAPSAAAEKQLKKIGLTGLDLANAMRGKDGLIGAVQLLKDHLDKSGMSAAEQSQILSRSFGGGKSSSGILAMVNNLDVLRLKQDQVNKTTGRFAGAVKTQRQTAEAQWKILTSNLETMTITMGTKLLPPITSFVKDINTKAIPAAGRLGDYLAKLVPIDRIKHDFATVTGMVGDFLSGLKGTKAPAVKLDASSFLTKPSGAVLPPLAAPKVKPIPSDAFQLSKNAALPPLLPPKPSPSEAKQAGQRLSAILTAGVGGMDWSKLGAKIGTLLEKAIGWIGGHTKELSGKVSDALEKVDWVDVGKSLGNMALPLSIGIVDNLFAPLFTAKFWKKHWLDTILGVVSVIPVGKLADGIGMGLSKIPWGKLGELIAKGWGKIPWKTIFTLGDRINWTSIFTIGGKINWSKVLTLGDLGPAVVRWASGVLGKIKDAFSGDWMSQITGWIGQQFGKLGGWISGQISLLPTRFGVALLDIGKWLTNHVPGLGNTFTRAIAKAIGRFSLYQTGVNLAQGLYNGIASLTGKAYTWVKTHWVDPMVNSVKSLFGVHSPSTVFAGIGRNLVQGLENGVIGAAKGIGAWAIAHIATPILSRFAGAKAWLVSRGSQLVTGLRNGVTNGAKGIATWAYSHVAQPLTSRFSAAHSWLTGRGSQLISGLKSGILGAMKNMSSWVKANLVDPLVHYVEKHFGIASPSKVFAGIGGHLVSGLIKGLATTNGSAIVTRIFGSMPKALAALVSKGLVHIEQLPSKAMSALSGLGGNLLGMLGLGGKGGGGTSGANQKIGKALMMAMGWSSAQWPALKALWNQESGWNANAVNPSSGAYGIPQALGHGHPFNLGDPAAQIKWGLSYIRGRYGSPAAAWAHETKFNWYDRGGLLMPGATLAMNGTGRPERIRTAKQEDDIVTAIKSLAHRPIVVQLRYNDTTLHDLIEVHVDAGLDELGTALGVVG